MALDTVDVVGDFTMRDHGMINEASVVTGMNMLIWCLIEVTNERSNGLDRKTSVVSDKVISGVILLSLVFILLDGGILVIRIALVVVAEHLVVVGGCRAGVRLEVVAVREVTTVGKHGVRGLDLWAFTLGRISLFGGSRFMDGLVVDLLMVNWVHMNIAIDMMLRERMRSMGSIAVSLVAVTLVIVAIGVIFMFVWVLDLCTLVLLIVEIEGALV